MQITLNQSEIETAIRRYVNEQVNIREGHEIVIDLKAGRGENGFTATIDILPDLSDTPTQAPAPAKSATTKPLGIQEKVQASRPVPEKPAPMPAEEEAVVEGQEVSQEAVADGGLDTDKQVKSLFANLQKPRNS